MIYTIPSASGDWSGVPMLGSSNEKPLAANSSSFSSVSTAAAQALAKGLYIYYITRCYENFNGWNWRSSKRSFLKRYERQA